MTDFKSNLNERELSILKERIERELELFKFYENKYLDYDEAVRVINSILDEAFRRPLPDLKLDIFYLGETKIFKKKLPYNYFKSKGIDESKITTLVEFFLTRSEDILALTYYDDLYILKELNLLKRKADEIKISLTPEEELLISGGRKKGIDYSLSSKKEIVYSIGGILIDGKNVYLENYRYNSLYLLEKDIISKFIDKVVTVPLIEGDLIGKDLVLRLLEE